MGQPVCELCGGTSFKKEDGMFVCEHCGTKYSAEEAKNLIKDDPLLKKVADATANSTAANISAASSLIASAVVQAFNKADFDPKGYTVSHKEPSEINNYACTGWNAAFDEYKAADHPTKEQQDALVETTKDCLYALDTAATIVNPDLVAATLIYRNCNAMIDAVKDTDYYEQQEDGTFKRNSLPFNTDFKISGQRDSWDDKQGELEKLLGMEYYSTHPDDAGQRSVLVGQIAQLEAELNELKDEKKSKGFFNFSAKREVKERMAPVKDQLAELRKQVSVIDRRVADDIDARIAAVPGYIIIK